jgi:uncharacterized protein (UPF0333 family)
MTVSIPLLLAMALFIFAAGIAVDHWLKSRKTSTKAELMYALTLEAKALAKMPGAAEAIELAQAQAQSEALAAAALAAAMQKAAGVSPSI